MTRGNMFSPEYYFDKYTSYDRFKDQIKEISNSFVKWRYSYEYGTLKYDESFALAFVEALKDVSYKLKEK